MNGRRIFAAVLTIFLFFGFTWPAEELPAQLSDVAFWNLINDFSEPGGAFVSDNFVSNERTFQRVLSELTEGRANRGVYLGVGPEQNFTYIVALKPKMAFIVDIRRQNMIEHLMYKALIEMSTDRADFLSRLFSRQKPAELTKNSTLDDLFNAFRNAAPSAEMFDANLSAMKKRLVQDHGFKLTDEDEKSLEFVFSAFATSGLSLTYSGPRAVPNRIMPTYEEVMAEADDHGEQRSYIATEESFLTLQQFERKNLVVPLVGDFAGPKAIRAVGDYVRAHNAAVSAVYTSNVEQYLFLNNSDAWKQYYANVATLPVNASSVFIRFNTDLGSYPLPTMSLSSRPVTLLCSVRALVAAFEMGNIATYIDVAQVCK
jgi:hypothetical protein